MGTYATTTSLDTLMPEVSFDTATTALATKCITWSEGEVNKYLSKRYDVTSFQTTTGIPPKLTDWSEQLAIGYMYRTMSRGSKESLARAKSMIDEVLMNLKMISEYKVDLLESDGSLVDDKTDTAYRVLSNTTDYTETFNEDDPLNWVIDPDKLSDIDSDRT